MLCQASKAMTTTALSTVVIRQPEAVTLARNIITEASVAAAQRQTEIRVGTVAGDKLQVILPQISGWLARCVKYSLQATAAVQAPT